MRFVVGGVIYPAYKNMFENVPLDGSSSWWSAISTRLSYLTGDLNKIYINLPIGGVKLAPNREKIQLIESNARTVRTTIEEFFKLLPKAFSSTANKIDNREQALAFISANWRMLVANGRGYPEHLLDYRQNRKVVKVDLSYYLKAEDLRWRDLEVPAKIATGASGWVSVNAATGVNIESHVHGAGSEIWALTHLIQNGLKRQPQQRFVISMPNLEVDSVKIARNNIRAYSEGAFAQSSSYAYLVPEREIDSQLREVFPVVSLSEFERVAKAYKRSIAVNVVRKPKVAIQFVNFSKQAFGVSASTTAEGHADLKNATFFSAHDAAVLAGSYSALARTFGEVRSGDGQAVLANGHLRSSAIAYLTDYVAGPLYLLGSNRSAKVIAKNFNEANSLLWRVYRDAQQQLATLGEARFGAMVASGTIFGSGYSIHDPKYAEQLDVLAVHASSLRSERLRHALTFHNDATPAQMNLARVLGMIDWSRFQSENEGLDENLMRLLGKTDDSRFDAWFTAFAKIKAKNASVVATVLDALASHHGWA